MQILLGMLAGLVTGVAGAFVAGIVQITGKRLRNVRLVKHGQPALKDVVFTPFWPLFGIVGAIAGGCWTWRIEGTWVTGAVAGAGLPALATLIFLVVPLAQMRRRGVELPRAQAHERDPRD